MEISRAAKFLEVGPNVYVITSENEDDKQKIWEGRPSFFDNHLLVMKRFDGLSPP